jgi:hypothetical protein
MVLVLLEERDQQKRIAEEQKELTAVRQQRAEAHSRQAAELQVELQRVKLELERYKEVVLHLAASFSPSDPPLRRYLNVDLAISRPHLTRLVCSAMNLVRNVTVRLTLAALHPRAGPAPSADTNNKGGATERINRPSPKLGRAGRFLAKEPNSSCSLGLAKILKGRLIPKHNCRPERDIAIVTN